MAKNKPQKQPQDERGIGMVLENIESKLDLVVEGHVALDAKIDKLDVKMEERFQEVDVKFDAVFDELHLIRNELKEKVGRDEFMVLEKRVLAIEKKLTDKRL